MSTSYGTKFDALSTSGANPLRMTPPVIPTGMTLIIATGRSALSGNPCGIDSILADTNTIYKNQAVACRTNVVSIEVNHIPITDALEGVTDEIGVYFLSPASSRKLAIGLPVGGLIGTKNAASAGLLNDSSVSVGSNGASNSPAGGSLTTSIDNCLLVAVAGYSGSGTTVTATPSGWTLRGQIVSNVGSGDRGIAMFTKEVSSAGTYSFPAATLSGSVTWAVAMAAYGITPDAETSFDTAWFGIDDDRALFPMTAMP